MVEKVKSHLYPKLLKDIEIDLIRLAPRGTQISRGGRANSLAPFTTHTPQRCRWTGPGPWAMVWAWLELWALALFLFTSQNLKWFGLELLGHAYWAPIIFWKDQEYSLHHNCIEELKFRCWRFPEMIFQEAGKPPSDNKLASWILYSRQPENDQHTSTLRNSRASILLVSVCFLFWSNGFTSNFILLVTERDHRHSLVRQTASTWSVCWTMCNCCILGDRSQLIPPPPQEGDKSILRTSCETRASIDLFINLSFNLLLIHNSICYIVSGSALRRFTEYVCYAFHLCLSETIKL